MARFVALCCYGVCDRGVLRVVISKSDLDEGGLEVDIGSGDVSVRAAVRRVAVLVCVCAFCGCLRRFLCSVPVVLVRGPRNEDRCYHRNRVVHPGVHLDRVDANVHRNLGDEAEAGRTRASGHLDERAKREWVGRSDTRLGRRNTTHKSAGAFTEDPIYGHMYV